MEFRWRGNGAGTKSAWNDGRNYVDGAGNAYAETRYPGSVAGVNDDVVFDQALGQTALSPAGYDGSSLEKLRSLTVGAAYDGTIGSADTWLTILAEMVNINAESAQNIFLEGASTTGIENMSVQAGSGVYVKGVASNSYVYGGTVDYATGTVASGSITIGAGGGSAAVVVLNSGMSLPSTVYQNGGRVTNYNSVTTLNITNGTWSQQTGNITTLRTNGGSCFWYSGNITTANLIGGSLDGSGSVAPRNIGTVYLYPNATFNMNDKVGSITVTDRIFHYGGTLTVAPNTQIARFTDDVYSGADNATLGIEPQTINNTTAEGNGVALSQNDKLDVFCIVGDISVDSLLELKMYESATSDFASESAITGKSAALLGYEGNKVIKFSVWGYELAHGNSFARLKIVENGAADALVAAQYVIHRM